MANKFRKVLVNRRLFTNGCKFLILDIVPNAYVKPNDLFEVVPSPHYKDNPFGFGMVKTDIPDPDTGADDTHLWAYPAPRHIRFGGEFYMEYIKPQEILVVDDRLDDDLLIDDEDDRYRNPKQ